MNPVRLQSLAHTATTAASPPSAVTALADRGARPHAEDHDDWGERLRWSIKLALPSWAHFDGGRVEAASGALYPVEVRHAERLVGRRRAEFEAGRIYARRALSSLGAARAEIPVAASRAPCWPSDVVGSISHAAGVCGATVAAREHVLALGFDLDTADPLPERLVQRICTSAELDAFGCLGTSQQLLAAKELFCIKESLYKAYAPCKSEFLGFLDVCVVVDVSAATFKATITSRDRPSMVGLHGWFGVVEGFCHALCVA